MVELTQAELDHLYPSRPRQAPPVKVKRPADPDHNLKLFGASIRQQVPGVGNDDLRWLANRSARMYKSLDKTGGCVDNYRVCLVTRAQVTDDYAERMANGCCGAADVLLTNPKTGNRYSIGFNYGH